MRTFTTAVAVALVLTVSACTAPASQTTTDEPAVSAPAVTPTPTLPPIQTGQALTGDDAERLPDGWVDYTTMLGGDHYAFDPAEPVPQPVMDDMLFRADTGIGDPIPSLVELEQTTGLRFIKVWYTYGTRIAYGEAHDIWSAVTPPATVIVPEVATRDEAVAGAQAFVAAQPDPTQWVILTIDPS